MRLRGRIILAAMTGLATMALMGCERSPDMGQQPRYQPYERSTFFADNTSARPAVPGAVAAGTGDRDTFMYTGKIDGKAAGGFPMAITERDLARGREQYAIFCSPCHGELGDGLGMIARRGFNPMPASFQSDRLRGTVEGHYFDVITNGYGAMYAYDYRIEPADRWRIIAYIRALQLSQRATVAELPEGMRRELESTNPPAGDEGNPQTP